MRFQISDFRWQIGGWIVVAALGATVLHGETIDRVLAVAANQVITLSDVTAAIDLGLQSTDGAGDPVRAVLSKLIDRELVLAEVDRYAPAEPTTEAVSREVTRVRWHAGRAMRRSWCRKASATSPRRVRASSSSHNTGSPLTLPEVATSGEP